MPRPGPRPYECVRRAWHSDRHQPMRGSMVQQIFRFVIETHSPATKKNKEWQEKLPTVVLKAEEILYSKANSEAEYSNSETLWDRVNDAINTIIRRDENNETGKFLPPCVEAALNLGCIPVRTSRSQRHSNPRSYLTPRLEQPSSAPTRVLDKTNDEQQTLLWPIHSENQLNLARNSSVNSGRLVSESNSHFNQNSSFMVPRSYPFSLEDLATRRDQFNTPLKLGSLYPLYHGTDHHMESQMRPQIPESPNYKTIYVGRPVITSCVEPMKRNNFIYANTGNPSDRTTQVNSIKTQEKQRDVECDLSLRLGLLSYPCIDTEKRLANETDGVGSSISFEGGKLSDMLSISKEFPFFPWKTANDNLKTNLRMLNSEDSGQISDANLRKRKNPFNGNDEDGRFCLQPEIPSNWFGSRPGL